MSSESTETSNEEMITIPRSYHVDIREECLRYMGALIRIMNGDPEPDSIAREALHVVED